MDSATLASIDRLEGEGSLYTKEKTDVVISGKILHEVYIYVYNHSVAGKKKVQFDDQPWGKEKEEELVWYASFGSNMLFERFSTYITGGISSHNGKAYPGCTNKNLPKEHRPITIPYRMYYGNKRSSWGEGGVSFLDIQEEGNTLGRMYLITKEQLEEKKFQEGAGQSWYHETVVLGEQEGIQILTMTNSTKRPSQRPSDAYLNTISQGLRRPIHE